MTQAGDIIDVDSGSDEDFGDLFAGLPVEDVLAALAIVTGTPPVPVTPDDASVVVALPADGAPATSSAAPCATLVAVATSEAPGADDPMYRVITTNLTIQTPPMPPGGLARLEMVASTPQEPFSPVEQLLLAQSRRKKKRAPDDAHQESSVKAANPKKKKKKPNAVSREIKHRPVADVDYQDRQGRAVPAHIRLQLQPGGCARCRRVPGCTRSCWLKRVWNPDGGDE